MAKNHDKKKPKYKQEPEILKKPKIKGQVEDLNLEPIWSFAIFDTDIRLPGGDINSCSFCEIASHLKSYEGMRWKDILNNHKRDHSIPIEDLEKFARDRLAELRLDDVDDIFRFRLTGKNRLWGFIKGNVFKALWWDPDHEICISIKRNT